MGSRSYVLTLRLLLSALLAVWAGSAQAILVNFDDVPGSGIQPIAGNRYIDVSVLFSTTGAGMFVFGPATYTNTPPNYGYASTYSSGEAANAPVIIDFVLKGTTTPGLTDICIFYVTDVPEEETGTWTAVAYGLGGGVLDSKSGTGSNVPVVFSGPTKQIARVIFTPSDDFEAIDTLSHCDVVPVPEPASLSVLGLGALGLIFRRRR